jgi:hypothetical protein
MIMRSGLVWSAILTLREGQGVGSLFSLGGFDDDEHGNVKGDYASPTQALLEAVPVDQSAYHARIAISQPNNVDDYVLNVPSAINIMTPCAVRLEAPSEWPAGVEEIRVLVQVASGGVTVTGKGRLEFTMPATGSMIRIPHWATKVEGYIAAFSSESILFYDSDGTLLATAPEGLTSVIRPPSAAFVGQSSATPFMAMFTNGS